METARSRHQRSSRLGRQQRGIMLLEPGGAVEARGACYKHSHAALPRSAEPESSGVEPEKLA